MYLRTFDEEFAQLCTFEGPPSTRLENSVAPESALVSSVQAYSHVSRKHTGVPRGSRRHVVLLRARNTASRIGTQADVLSFVPYKRTHFESIYTSTVRNQEAVFRVRSKTTCRLETRGTPCVFLEHGNMPVLTTPKRILALHCFRDGSRGVPRMCKAAQTLRQKCGDRI